MFKKIITPLVFVGCLWLMSTGVTTYFLGRVEESYERSNAENLTTIVSASAMVGRFWRLHTAALMANQHLADFPQKEFDQRIADFEAALAEAEATSLTEPEEVCVTTIRCLFAQYREHLDLHLNSTSGGGGPCVSIDDQMILLADQIWQECKSLRNMNKQLLDEMVVEQRRLIKSLNLARHAVAFIGPIIGGLFGFWISRSLHRSVSQVSVTLREAVGALEHEIGQVVVAFPTALPALQQQAQVVAVQIQNVLNELQKARDQVAATERLALAGELAAGVAHEIRNPLTSVKLLVQMAARRGPNHCLDEKQLRVIQDEIGRMERTIESLLAFARPAQLHRMAHDLRDTGHHVLNLLSGRASQQKVMLADRFSQQPVVVNGDPILLQQVMVNLILNGIESMPHGGQLEFAIGIDDTDDKECRIVVGDSGGGIAPDLLERIFDPFVTTKENGTGLGLAISRRIILKHGGTIAAANRPFGGAEFTVRLPLSSEDSLEPAR
jgi:two-component system, NtrC family, sensor histidine kinase HydH